MVPLRIRFAAARAAFCFSQFIKSVFRVSSEGAVGAMCARVLLRCVRAVFQVDPQVFQVNLQVNTPETPGCTPADPGWAWLKSQESVSFGEGIPVRHA